MSEGINTSQKAGGELSRKDYIDFLFKSYVELNNHARHQENLRSVVTTAIISLSAACLGLITFLVKDGATSMGSKLAYVWAIVLAFCIVGLGLFGAAFVLRASNRYARWRQAAVAFAEAGNLEFERAGYQSPTDIYRSGIERAEQETSYMAGAKTIRLVALAARSDPTKTKTSVMWVRMMLAVSGVGVLLALVCAGLAAKALIGK